MRVATADRQGSVSSLGNERNREDIFRTTDRQGSVSSLGNERNREDIFRTTNCQGSISPHIPPKSNLLIVRKIIHKEVPLHLFSCMKKVGASSFFLFPSGFQCLIQCIQTIFCMRSNSTLYASKLRNECIHSQSLSHTRPEKVSCSLSILPLLQR